MAEIDSGAAVRDAAGEPGRGALVQQLAYAAAQHARVDGLGDVAVAARVRRLLLVAFHRESGQGDHRDIARSLIRLDAAGHLEPVHSGQLDVGENQPRMVAAQ